MPGWVVSDGTVGRKTAARLYFSGTAAAAGNSGGPLLDGGGALVGLITGEGGAGVAVEADALRLIIRGCVPALPAVAAQSTAPPPLIPEPKASPPTRPRPTGGGDHAKDGAEMVLVPAGSSGWGATTGPLTRSLATASPLTASTSTRTK
jgi:hypothetical protein